MKAFLIGLIGLTALLGIDLFPRTERIWRVYYSHISDGAVASEDQRLLLALHQSGAQLIKKETDQMFIVKPGPQTKFTDFTNHGAYLVLNNGLLSACSTAVKKNALFWSEK